MISIYLSMIESPEDRDKVIFLYESHYSFMCWCAGEILGHNKPEVQDAVHNAMISIIENLHRIDFSNPKRVKNFCGIVARNKAINYGKSQRGVVSPVDEVTETELDRGELPDEIVIGDETYEIILGKIEELDEKYRDVCLLRFIHGCREKDIASLLGVPESTVSTRISRAKVTLRDSLRKEGLYV